MRVVGGEVVSIAGAFTGRSLRLRTTADNDNDDNDGAVPAVSLESVSQRFGSTLVVDALWAKLRAGQAMSSMQRTGR